MAMKDFLGRELKIGDKVVTGARYSKSGRLREDVIIGFGASMVKLAGGAKSPEKLVKIFDLNEEEDD